jgi:hypothetical protein
MKFAKFLIIIMLVSSLFFAGCQKEATVKVRFGVDWNWLRQSMLYATLNPQSWSMPAKPKLPETGIIVAEKNPPLAIVDVMFSGQGTVKTMENTKNIIELRKDEFTSLVEKGLSDWDLEKVATRAENIPNILHVKQPFSEIVIQPDPVLPPGLTVATFDRDIAYIIVPAFVGQQNFDAAYINALITWDLGNRKPDFERLEAFCTNNNAFLPATKQFSADMAYTMSTWLEGTVEPEYRSFLLKSSLAFGHMFTLQVSQWAGNYFQFIGNTTLSEVIENAVRDCENPLYQKLFDKVRNPGKLELVISDTKDGATILDFSGDSSRDSGLEIDDVIYDMDTRPIKALWEIQNLLFDKSPGDEVIVKVRRNKSQKAISQNLEQLGEENGKLLLGCKLRLASAK